MPETTYKRIAALAKGIEVLLAVSKSGPVSASSLAAVLDMPKGTVMCHLHTLADTGLVEICGDVAKLGMRAAELWAKRKSALEGERGRIDAELREIDL
jgi:DNA-binding IclR family transcriptional regulator